MMGRALLLTVFGMTIIAMMIVRNATHSLTLQNENVTTDFQRIQGRNIAQAGVNLGLRRLVYTRKSSDSFGTSFSDPGGNKIADVNVVLQDATYKGKPAVKIVATATMSDHAAWYSFFGRETTFSSTAFVPKATVPKNVRSALQTNNFTRISGNLVVDGRDHDTSGALGSPHEGTFGVWTSDSLFVQNASSIIGGTNIRGSDFAPSNPADTSVIRTRQTAYPTSPDSVLGGPANGFPEGTLKAIAISQGHYYSGGAVPSGGLSGVTYVEMPDTNTPWLGAKIDGSGILVVHNPTGTSWMKNVNSGVFRGIVLCDDISHINGKLVVIGSVVGLTRVPSSTNDIGNGNANILYSNAAISTAIAAVRLDPVSTYTNRVLAWWE